MLRHDLQPAVTQMWRFLLPFIDDTLTFIVYNLQNFFDMTKYIFAPPTQTNSLS